MVNFHLADPILPHSAESRQQRDPSRSKRAVAEKTKRKNTQLDGTWILRIALQLSMRNVGVWCVDDLQYQYLIVPQLFILSL